MSSKTRNMVRKEESRFRQAIRQRDKARHAATSLAWAIADGAPERVAELMELWKPTIEFTK